MPMNGGSMAWIIWVMIRLTYGEFIDRVLERFDQKDPELSFKELAQLKQVGTPTDYMH